MAKNALVAIFRTFGTMEASLSVLSVTCDFVKACDMWPVTDVV